MPRKAKDEEIKIEEKKEPKIKKTATAKKATTAKKSVAKKTTTQKKSTTKKTVAKKTTTQKKSTTKEKVAKKPTTQKKSTAKKTVAKKIDESNKSATAKKTTKASASKTTPKKESTEKNSSNAKKATTKKDSTAKKTTTKKASSSKTTTTKKTNTTKKTTTTKKSVAKKSITKKASEKVKTTTSKKVSIFSPLSVLEYYDLPYRYNETTIKILAQNPNTLFAYWDINDNDRQNFENNYGKDFFTKTKPVLVVHNLTTNKTDEIDIDDFANNWYIHVDSTKCKYVIELGRRPIYSSTEQKLDYLNIAYSNAIEIPNDHILFFKENDKIQFKNIRTNKITEKTFKNSIYRNGITEIYKNYNISENQDKYDLQNPSSDFLSMNVL